MEQLQTGHGDHLTIKLPLDAWVPTVFEPQREPVQPPARGLADDEQPRPSSSSAADAEPEKKLTLFALRLAILEKAASGVGALGFIWATVVLLGGFAITLQRKDFWFITVILLIEGARIFSRSHELEWQHQATWSLAEAGALSFRAIRSSSLLIARAVRIVFSASASTGRNIELAPPNVSPTSVNGCTWRSPEVPLLPIAGWVFLSRNISRVLFWLQLVSATACVVLSLMRLAQQDYGEVRGDEAEKRNRRPALNIFYGLALAEALLFLAERGYWEWKVSRRRILEEVNRECGLGPTGMVSVRRFFYDAYSRCVNGSIFDGIRMDLVSFAEELLGSGSRDEELIGARILLRFATNRRFAGAAMRKIGTSAAAMERLVEMLNWKSADEEEIRRAAAVVVAKLAGKKQNALRVAGIPGAMESISSLLYTGRAGNGNMPEEVTSRHILPDRTDYYEYSTFNLLGLSILKKLANDHDNCGKIGNTRGLLPKIIGFTSGIGRKLHRRKASHSSSAAAADPDIQSAKRALQLLRMLAETTGRTGELLRREISEIVFTVGNIREILRHGEEEKTLQKLGVEILTSLAMDGEARERIGATGGVVRELLRMFFHYAAVAGSGVRDAARVDAGEALAMLVVESEGNCVRLVKEGEEVVERLIRAVGDAVVGVNACMILRNLCAYGPDHDALCLARVRGVIKAFPTVLNAIMFGEMKQLEVSIGFAAQIVRFMSPTEFMEELDRANIQENELIECMVHILQQHSYPSIRAPRIRRFVIELSFWMMQSNEKNIKLFKDYGMEKELHNIADTTSDLECFIVFSGCVGLTRHRTDLSSLVDTAMELLVKDESS